MSQRKISRLRTAGMLDENSAIDLAGLFGDIAVAAQGKRQFIMSMVQFAPGDGTEVMDTASLASAVQEIAAILQEIQGKLG